MSSGYVSFGKQPGSLTSEYQIPSMIRDEIDSFISGQSNLLSQEAKEALSSLVVKSNSFGMSAPKSARTITQNIPEQQGSTTNKTIRNAMCLIGGLSLLCLVYTVAKNKGYAEGYADTISGSVGYENGKNDGINIGYKKGYEDGVETGSKNAYQKGFLEGCKLLSNTLLEVKEKIYQAMLNNGWTYLQCNQVMEEVDILPYGDRCHERIFLTKA